jgi:hypothetical protein
MASELMASELMGALIAIHHRLLTDRSSIGAQKLACLLLYFEYYREASCAEEEARLITFQHLRCPSQSEFGQALMQCKARVGRAASESVDSTPQVTLHASSMEAPPVLATAFVNFANANFGCKPRAPTDAVHRSVHANRVRPIRVLCRSQTAVSSRQRRKRRSSRCAAQR